MPNRLAIAPSSVKYRALRALAGLENILRGHQPTTPQHLSSIRNFLFLQYDTPLGSAVHATPLYEAIQLQLPDATIFVAASPMAAGVLRHNPFLDRCVVTPAPSQSFTGALRALRQLYAQLPPGPVCIATTASNQRPTLAMLALLTGKATRLGYTLATPLYSLPLEYDADRPQIESNLDILRALHPGTFSHAAPIPEATPEPRIFFSREDAAYATRVLAEASVTADHPRIAFVTQSSGGQPKLWSVERFRRVIAELHATRRAIPIFLGTSDDAAAVEALRQPLSEQGISLAGKTTIPQLAAVLAQCDAILSLDTGTFHVARAVQLPGVVIAPAWQNPSEWLPLRNPRYRILCGAMIPMPTSKYWIQEVSTEQVLASLDALLTAYPPSASARAARLHRALAKKTP
ncbi:MAG TPA: glycosyltransferase family 9 protein [Acidobacteriaceae bacterium]|jgi:ADP-heptose:LPS heptosyltransferase|nr:glycosyltransferase family 9 protein [Acidobacteriaceae bacterium]